LAAVIALESERKKALESASVYYELAKARALDLKSERDRKQKQAEQERSNVDL